MEYDFLHTHNNVDSKLIEKFSNLLQNDGSQQLSCNLINGNQSTSLVQYALHLTTLNLSHQSISDTLQTIKTNQLNLLSNTVFATASIVYVLNNQKQISSLHALDWLAQLQISNDVKGAIYDLNFASIENTYLFCILKNLSNQNDTWLKIQNLKRTQYKILLAEAKCLDIVLYGISALLNRDILSIWDEYQVILKGEYEFENIEAHQEIKNMPSLFDRYPLTKIFL